MPHWQGRVLFLVCILLMIGSVIFSVWTFAWVSVSTVVDGQVIEVIMRSSEEGRSFVPRVTYKLDNQFHEFVPLLASGSPEFEIGEQVKVVVSRDREREVIGSFAQLYLVPTILFCLGVVLAVEIAVFQVGEKLFYLLHPQLK